VMWTFEGVNPEKYIKKQPMQIPWVPQLWGWGEMQAPEAIPQWAEAITEAVAGWNVTEWV
jgi:hypothetical protein